MASCTFSLLRLLFVQLNTARVIRKIEEPRNTI